MLSCVLMEFTSVLGICRSPSPVGLQETLDHIAAWGNSELLKCFSASDFFKTLHNSDGDAGAIMLRARQALMLRLVSSMATRLRCVPLCENGITRMFESLLM